MRKNILFEVGLAVAVVVSACETKGPETPCARYQEISASIENGMTKTTMSEAPDSYDMMTKWEGFEIIKIFRKSFGGLYHDKVVDVKISDLTADGTGAKFKYEVPQDWVQSFDKEYEVKCFTMSSHPVVKDDMLYFNASLVRRRLADFQVPVYWTGVAGTDENVLSATFGHYYTYEILHIRNSSSSSINFSLVGFQGNKTWYKEKGSICLEDGTFDVAGPATQDPVRESEPFDISAGGSDMVVSAYIPNGFKIQDATLYALIDGESVHSINKKTSDVTLQTGHAYHLFADWDGKDLRILDGPFENEKSEYVDLGLPSGLKWATCNVGASKPEDYGGYYQWAGLQDVTDTSIYLDWSNCPYHTGSSESIGWTKYIPLDKSSYWSSAGSPDNKSVLDPEDDVAHVKLGGKWRMPTDAEFNELIDNCTSEWTTLNGVSGRKFTSKKNDNSIFLPAAGIRSGGSLSSAGSFGDYRSSTLWSRYPSGASVLYFYSGRVYTDCNARYFGLSVRPVYDEGLDDSGVDIKDGLVAYYPFDGDVNDATGNGHDGSIHGNVVLTSDRHGNPNSAYWFPGSSWNYISVPDSPQLSLDEFTLSAWVYSDNEDAGYGFQKNGYIINKGRDINNGSYHLQANSVGAQVQYYGINTATIDTIPSIGSWHNITGTVKGSTARLYVDGILMKEQTLSSSFKCSNNDILTIGMHYYGGVPNGYAYPHYGAIDDVYIYNRALTDSEVRKLYGR